MKTSKAVVWLSWLIAGLALVAAGSGLFYQDGGSPFSFTTLRGETVQLYGQGLYRYDTPLAALSFKGSDVITLVLAIPLLILSTMLYRRGSLKGGVLLSGALAYFLYNYGGMAFGTAYNNLFLVYVVLFSASLFAVVVLLTSFDLQSLPSHFAASLPRRGIGGFLIGSGMILTLIWLVLSIVPALLQGQAPPEVKSYTTFMTGVVDLAIVAPALMVAGALLLRRAPSGYLLAATLLVFTVILGPNLIVGGMLQLLTGVISIGQALGFSVPFAILTLIAIWFTIVLFRNFSDGARLRAAQTVPPGRTADGSAQATPLGGYVR